MEGLEEIRGAEGGMEQEFHEIPSQGPSRTSQAEYIHAPAQGYQLLMISAEYWILLVRLITLINQH